MDLPLLLSSAVSRAADRGSSPYDRVGWTPNAEFDVSLGWDETAGGFLARACAADGLRMGGAGSACGPIRMRLGCPPREWLGSRGVRTPRDSPVSRCRRIPDPFERVIRTHSAIRIRAVSTSSNFSHFLVHLANEESEETYVRTNCPCAGRLWA